MDKKKSVSVRAIMLSSFAMKNGIDSFHLKITALLLMLLDHSLKVFMYELLFFFQYNYGISYEAFYIPFSLISSFGTISFFLFVFLSAEGCRYTRNRTRHVLVMLLFALLSEYPFRELRAVITMVPDESIITFSNVIYTLLLGCLSVYAYDYLDKKEMKELRFIPPLLFSFIAILLDTDYSCFGVLALFFIWYFREDRRKQVLSIAGAAFIVWGIYYPLSDILINGFKPLNLVSYISKAIVSQLSALLVLKYNGLKGRSAKYFFYIFYPVHMLLLVWLYLSI